MKIERAQSIKTKWIEDYKANQKAKVAKTDAKKADVKKDEGDEETPEK